MNVFLTLYLIFLSFFTHFFAWGLKVLQAAAGTSEGMWRCVAKNLFFALLVVQAAMGRILFFTTSSYFIWNCGKNMWQKQENDTDSYKSYKKMAMDEEDGWLHNT